MTIVPATLETEAGDSLEARGSSLGNVANHHLFTKKKKEKK